ncbi:MAG: DUF4236 domain-containing protein [Marinilabiliaceae bacterium]|nr:DUF4236 domain-containing protein [Marinilabiliaceae bacterium]
MVWNYRKRITIAPGVRLNVSKKGVSSTFGMRGASINVGRNGTYLNTGIPGTGIYSRRKIGGGSPNSFNSQSNKSNYNGCGITTLIFLVVGLFLILSQDLENPVLLFFGCAGAGIILDIIINLIIDGNKKGKAKKVEQSIESQIEIAKNAFNQSSNPIQKEILLNYISCTELSKKADEIEAIIEALKQKIEKKKNPQLEAQLEKYKAELLKITTELDDVQLDVDKDLDDVEKGQYSILCENFEKILSCKKIWLITFSIRNTELKSSAASTVERKEIGFDVGVFNYIKSSFDIPMLRDLSGNIYYIYPRYIIKAKSFTNFEVFPIDTISFRFSKQRFIEDSVLPEDSVAVDYTYQYVNKNGGPDKRFSYNPRLPIVEYGKLEIEKFGLTYHISNYSAVDEFVSIYNLWQSKLPIDNNIPTQDEKQHNFLSEVDPLFEDAAHLIVTHQQGSTSLIQRQFSIGYNRAGRIMDELELAGIVGQAEGSKPRQMLIANKFELETLLKNLSSNLAIKRNKEQLNINEDFEIDKLIETQKDEISQDFFNEVNKSVTKILDLCDDLKNNKKFISLTQKFGILEKDKKQLVSDLFVFDILTCYEKFNEKINLNTKSGCGLLLWLVKINTEVTISQPNQLNIYIPTIEKMVDISLNKRELYLTAYPNTNLFIADLLNDYPEMKSKYLILLYRFFSIVAKADNIITKDEQKWLSELLNLSENKNEEKTKITETDFQLETKSTKKTDFREELNSLIGLTSVKTEISTLANFIKIQQERQSKGLKTSQPSYHCVFTGNPGTGKTTVARIVAEIYKELGILKKGHLVETDRSGLVAEYVGQTAVKTNKIIDTALDGILFIDEAYSLISESGNDYGKEAIATLLKRMEDNRDRLVVILAGYTTEMQQFIDSNPGLQSRFNRYIEFSDYSDVELYQIFELNLKQFDYTIAENAIIPLQEYLTKTIINKDKNFGNARFVRNLFEKTIERQANRLSKEVDLTNEKLSEICFVDIPM